MSITHSYVDYGAGNDTTGDGSIGTPWKTLQKAFDTLTRNTTDGNQVNLKAGTAHVNAAALDLTTFLVADCAAAKDLVRLQARGLVAEVDWETAQRWGMRGPLYGVRVRVVERRIGVGEMVAPWPARSMDGRAVAY